MWLGMVIVTSLEWLDHLPAVEAVPGSPFNVMSLTHLIFLFFFFSGDPDNSMASVSLITKKPCFSQLH